MLNKSILEKLLINNNIKIIEIIKTTKYKCSLVVNKNNETYFLKVYELGQTFSNNTTKYLFNKELEICNIIKNNYSFIIAFYDFFYLKNYGIFVYEYFKKGSIKTYFKGKVFNNNNITVLIHDLYSGLEQLKSINIYHKYIHEDNIFLSRNSIKIAGLKYCDIYNNNKLV